jgi:hypothetical protein
MNGKGLAIPLGRLGGQYTPKGMSLLSARGHSYCIPDAWYTGHFRGGSPSRVPGLSHGDRPRNFPQPAPYGLSHCLRLAE